MIMALHFECDGPTIANVHHARIFFAGLDQNVSAGGGKFFQFLSRILVRAMFTPHHGKNSELSEVRFAAEEFLDSLKLFWREAVSLHEFRRNNGIATRRFAAHRHVRLM